ncbi:MAG: MFS transporter [Planctomycetota bacterium]
MAKHLGVFTILLALTAFAVTSAAIPPLATTISAELKIAYESFGYIYMTYFLSFALGGLAGGRLVTHFGFHKRFLVLTGLIGTGIIFLCLAALRNFAGFIVLAVPFGILGGWVETFASIMISEYDRPKSSRFINLSQAFYCIGAIAAPQIAAVLLSFGFSWRIAMLIFALGVLSVGILFKLHNRRGITGCATDIPACTEITLTSSTVMLTDPFFILLAFALFMYVSIEFSAACWIAPYFEKHLALSPASAACRVALFWTGVIAARLVVFFLLERFTLWPVKIVAAASMIVINFLLFMAATPLLATVLVILSGIAHGPLWPVTVAIAQNQRNCPKFTAAVVAAGALGAALGPLASSYVIKFLGNEKLFLTLALGSILLFATILATYYVDKRACRCPA